MLQMVVKIFLEEGILVAKKLSTHYGCFRVSLGTQGFALGINKPFYFSA